MTPQPRLAESLTPYDIRCINWAAEHTKKRLLVLWHSRNLRDGGVQAGLAHFARIRDGESCSFLKSLGAAVPELRHVVESIQSELSLSIMRLARPSGTRR